MLFNVNLLLSPVFAYSSVRAEGTSCMQTQFSFHHYIQSLSNISEKLSI